MASVIRIGASQILAPLRKLLCFLLDHVDEVTNVVAHSRDCRCRLGGHHGDVSYRCRRCKREETCRELVV